MVDRYRDFQSLAREQLEGIDYLVTSVARTSPVAVIAPHGGFIEPGTSEAARAVAGEDHSFYAFEGMIPMRKHGDLHITSARFDEPVGCEIVAKADFVVAMHGRANGDDEVTIWLGGLDAELVATIDQSLLEAGFSSKVITVGDLAGRNGNNICNRGARGAGVQLELPRTLRDELTRDGRRMATFAAAIRSAVERRGKSLAE